MKKTVIFIGFGSIGQRHYLNILNCRNDIHVKTYIGENKSEINVRPNNKINKEKIEILSTKKNLKENLNLLNAGDIVLICNRSSEHSFYLEFVNDNISENILIIVEKPLATNISDLEKIKHLTKKNNIFVISQFRYSPVFTKIKNFINHNVYGNLISFSFINHEAIERWHPWENFKNSYSTKKIFGGGCLLTQIHDIEIMYGLLGLPEKAHFYFGDGKNLEIDVDDYYLGSFIYKKDHDIFGTIASSYYSNAKPRIHSFTFENAFITWDLNYDLLEINFKKENVSESFERNDLFFNLAKEIVYFSDLLNISKIDLIHNDLGLIPLDESYKLTEWLLSKI